MLSVGGLFSGIGGWELGLERAGMRVLWHCEADPYARAVLERHWPGVPCYPDVRELRGVDVEPVDILAGGFPCQDISVAGRGAGIGGERSGLWSEMFRLTCELRPRYLLVENVSALVSRGLDVVLTDLASIGFDAEWDCLRASDFGAPHRRERIWLVAYSGGARRRQDAGGAHGDEGPHAGRRAQDDHVVGRDGQGGRAGTLADTESNGRRQGWPGRPAGDGQDWQDIPAPRVGDAYRASAYPHAATGPSRGAASKPGRWPAEPPLDRMAHGVPRGVDQLRCLGNALVPQIAEWIGRRVIAYEQEREVAA